MDMKEQRFGIEIEMTGLSRQRAAQVLSEFFERPANFDGGYYGEYSVLDSQSRRWKVMSDGSITTERKEGRRVVSADSTYSVELVSPICRYEDIKTIQEIVRKLRGAGMLVNKSCGIHIHLDASPHNANTLRNITNIMASKEDLIYKAMQVEVARERQYCKKVEQSFLEELNRKKPQTLDAVSRIWYHGSDGRRDEGEGGRVITVNEPSENAVRAAIDRVNHDLSVIEKVRGFVFADEPFTIENEQLTPSMKIRRHKIREIYGERMDALYRG
mgnify:CR=1 FL=1